jgi:hypothetical protein
MMFKFASDVENSSKALGLVTLLAYAVGTLAQNLYLRDLGISDFEVFRIKAIFTGTLVLGVLAASWAYGWYVLHLAQSSSHSKWIVAKVANAVMAVTTVIVLYGGCYKWLKSYGSSTEVALWLPSLIFVFGWAPALIWLLNRRLEKLRGSAPNPMGYLFHLVVLMYVLTFVGVFSHYFYPLVPEQIGGGRPRVVRLITTSSAMDAMDKLGGMKPAAYYSVELLY